MRALADEGVAGTFATLSPVPGFAEWYRACSASERVGCSDEERRWVAHLSAAAAAAASKDDGAPAALLAGAPPTVAAPMLALLSQYLSSTHDGRPLDRVARFHLGNGAQLLDVRFGADASAEGLCRSFGMMANYAYADGGVLESNRRALRERGEVSMSTSVRSRF